MTRHSHQKPGPLWPPSCLFIFRCATYNYWFHSLTVPSLSSLFYWVFTPNLELWPLFRSFELLDLQYAIENYIYVYFSLIFRFSPLYLFDYYPFHLNLLIRFFNRRILHFRSFFLFSHLYELFFPSRNFATLLVINTFLFFSLVPWRQYANEIYLPLLFF